MPTYLSQEADVARVSHKRVSLWEHSTRQTCPAPCGRTSCLGAGSAGSWCPSSPRPQRNSKFVDLQRDGVSRRPSTRLRETLSLLGSRGRKGNPEATLYRLCSEEGGIRKPSWPFREEKTQTIHLEYHSRRTQGQEGHLHMCPECFAYPGVCLPIFINPGPPGNWS
jgi:hypothetical protein